MTFEIKYYITKSAKAIQYLKVNCFKLILQVSDFIRNHIFVMCIQRGKDNVCINPTIRIVIWRIRVYCGMRSADKINSDLCLSFKFY